jgi:hypothetical protein
MSYQKYSTNHQQERTMKIFLISFILVLLCVEVVLVASMYIIMTRVTQGARIAEYKNPQKALLVIDVQEDATGTTALSVSPYKGQAEYIARLNKVIDDANNKKILIVYIKQGFKGLWGKTLSWAVLGGSNIKGTPGIKVDKRVAMLSNTSSANHGGLILQSEA